MHRLVIVSGPNRGSSFSLASGENLIGRQMDNHIVLSSSRVSKKHCSLVVNSNEVFLRDEGSTNGTFVNGALTKQQSLRSGDKLGVGEFVLELVKPVQAPIPEVSRVDSFSGGALAPSGNTNSAIFTGGFNAPAAFPGAPAVTGQSGPVFGDLEPEAELPDDPVSKLKFLFEGKIMPVFYGMMMKGDFPSTAKVVFLVAGLIAIAGSVMPIQDLAEQSIRREAFLRAKVLSREVADRFAGNIAAHTESQIDFSFLENEDSIKSVVITNPSMQIIAPASRLNQVYAGGMEAGFAIKMGKAFREGRETGNGDVFSDQNIAVWVEPIRLNDSKQVRSQVAAMVIVAIDFSSNMIADGALGVAYGTSAAIGGIALLLAFIILMRTAAKPYEVLNEELDQVLRGEIGNVTQEFKTGGTEALWDNINAAIQRLPKGGGGRDQDDNGSIGWDQFFEGLKSVAEMTRSAFAGFDGSLNIQAINEIFTEASGIRSDAVGQAVSLVGDQALAALIVDLTKNAQTSPNRLAMDRFAFQGDDYDVVANWITVKSQSGLAVIFKRRN